MDKDMMRKNGSLHHRMQIIACQMFNAIVVIYIFLYLRRSSMSILDALLFRCLLEPCLLVLRSRCHCQQAEIYDRQSVDTKSTTKGPKIKGKLHVLFPKHSSCSPILFQHLHYSFGLDIALIHFIGARKMTWFISSNLTGGKLRNIRWMMDIST